MEYKSKYNEKIRRCDIAVRIDDYTDLIEKSVLDNIRTTIVQHDILDIILEIFIHMTACGKHIDDIQKTYNEETREYSVSFHFGKFAEDVEISWGKNVSVIDIKAYTFACRFPEGHIAIIVRPDKPPLMSNLSDHPTPLIDIIFKHLKRELDQYRPNII